ncbi:hypothetical protein WEH80_05510 [Actinomycetes bacterium KLBMP 9759]
MRMQVGRVLGAVAVVGVVISGCGGPSQVGSAVIVGDHSVSLGQVQSKIDTALANTDAVAQIKQQGFGPADIARNIVTNEVLHDLLQRRAAADKIVVDDAAVDAFLATQGGPAAVRQLDPFADLDGIRTRVRDDLIAAELGRRSVAGLAVTIDLVGAASRDDAEKVAKALFAGGPAAEQALNPPPAPDGSVPVQRGRTLVAAAIAPQLTPGDPTDVLFGAPVGSVGMLQSGAQSGWTVFRIADRRTDAPVDPAALTAIGQAQFAQLGHRQVQTLADAVGVKVNPRYGVWDPITLRVVPKDAVGVLLLPPPAAPVTG